MKKWVDAHRAAHEGEGSRVHLGCQRNRGQDHRYMTSMTLLLAPTLEIDVSNVTICLGNFYQGLLGCDLLCGHNKVLSGTTISLPRLD